MSRYFTGIDSYMNPVYIGFLLRFATKPYVNVKALLKYPTCFINCRRCSCNVWLTVVEMLPRRMQEMAYVWIVFVCTALPGSKISQRRR